MAERRLRVGRSVEEPENSSEAAGKEKPEPGEEGGWGESAGEEAEKEWRLLLLSCAAAAESRMLRLRMLVVCTDVLVDVAAALLLSRREDGPALALVAE